MKESELKLKESETVVIEVMGGVASLASKPKNINVLIKDYDNAEPDLDGEDDGCSLDLYKKG